MLNELFITLYINGASIMNPFTFIQFFTDFLSRTPELKGLIRMKMLLIYKHHTYMPTIPSNGYYHFSHCYIFSFFTCIATFSHYLNTFSSISIQQHPVDADFSSIFLFEHFLFGKLLQRSKWYFMLMFKQISESQLVWII